MEYRPITQQQLLKLLLKHDNELNIALLGEGGYISSVRPQGEGRFEIELQQAMWRDTTVRVRVTDL